MPGRKFTAGTGYRYGFNGKDKDNEVLGDGNQYDYGFRIYNPRIGRFLSTDPLFKSYPWYTPYQFAGNKPVLAIDLDGLEEEMVIDKWAGVTYGFFEFDIGLGLGLGLNYTYQNGFAYDEVGKTKYSAKLTLYVSNQIKEALEKNTPNFIAGASASATVNVQQNWKHETYLGAVGAISIGLPTNITPKVKGLKLGDIVAVNASISAESVTLGIGVGYGIKLAVINTSIIQSVSLTDDQVNTVQDKAGVWFELNAEWVVKNIQPVKNEYGTTTSYKSDLYTKDKKGKEISTGISLISGAVNSTKIENGKPITESTSDNLWRSPDYQKEATEAEQNGGTIIK